MREAIILAGGQSLRMKPYYPWNKALLKIGEQTLLDRQICWLLDHGFDHIVIATTEDILNRWHEINPVDNWSSIDVSLEWKKLGTSGAVFRAMDYVTSDVVYIMNVDDLLLDFSPSVLYNELNRGAIVVLHKPRIGFGLARIKNGLIRRFQEKPTIKYWVSCGHYLFKKETVRDYFKVEGDLEREVLPVLAKEKQLQGYKYHGRWITINTWKDYIAALETLGLLSCTEIYSPVSGGYVYDKSKRLY